MTMKSLPLTYFKKLSRYFLLVPLLALLSGELFAAPSSLSITGFSAGPYCKGTIADLTIAYTSGGTGNYNAGNTFSVELSSSTGTFPGTIIGTSAVTLTPGGSVVVRVTIPAGATAAAAYRVRLVSSAPSFNSGNNGSSITITSPNVLDNASLSSSTVSRAAYSVRKLSSGYTGFVMEVRRASDNATANVNFDGSTIPVISAASTVKITAAGSGSGNHDAIQYLLWSYKLLCEEMVRSEWIRL